MAARIDKLLGPRWSDEEIETFFNGYSQHKTEWAQVSQFMTEKGLNRTEDMIKAMYLKNKAYLSLASARAEDLKAIMADHYNSHDMEIDASPTDESQNEETAQRSEERSSNRHDDSPKKLAIKIHRPLSHIKHEHEEMTMTGYRKRRSKKNPYVSPYDPARSAKMKASVSSFQIDTPNSKGLKPGDGFGGSLSAFDGARRGKKANSRRAIKLIKERNHKGFTVDEYGPHIIYNRDGSEDEIDHAPYLWACCEWFYAWIDRAFFNFNDMKNLLQRADLQQIESLTRLEWGVVRQAMGKTRRFSPKFIDEERKRLDRYREGMRQYYKTEVIPSLLDDISAYIKAGINRKVNADPIVVGRRVLALHPKSFRLDEGIILTFEDSNFHVQFDKTELGVCKISDLKLIPLLSSQSLVNEMIVPATEYQPSTKLEPELSQSQTSLSTANVPSDLLQGRPNTQFRILKNLGTSSQHNMNIYAVSLLFIILERKNKLLELMRQFNSEAEGQDTNVTEDFRQQFAWAAVNVKTLDSALQAIVPHFRMRISGFDESISSITSLMEHVNAATQDVGTRASTDSDLGHQPATSDFSLNLPGESSKESANENNILTGSTTAIKTKQNEYTTEISKESWVKLEQLSLDLKPTKDTPMTGEGSMEVDIKKNDENRNPNSNGDQSNSQKTPVEAICANLSMTSSLTNQDNSLLETSSKLASLLVNLVDIKQKTSSSKQESSSTMDGVHFIGDELLRFLTQNVCKENHDQLESLQTSVENLCKAYKLPSGS